MNRAADDRGAKRVAAGTGCATTLLILLEGAHVLSRAAADIAPFDDGARVILAYAQDRFGD
jgi:hypothetical protein